VTNPRDANIVCPKDDCGHQLSKSKLLDYDSENFEDFVAGMQCPECRTDFHPEDGLLEYLSTIPIDEAAYHSLSIGGFCSQGTKRIEPGRTDEESLITSFEISVSVGDTEEFSGSDQTDLELGIPYVWDPEGRDFEDIIGDSVNPAFGPTLVSNDQIVADINDVSDPDGPLELAFTTSIRESIDVDEITLGYHYDTYLANVQGPSWIELLREGIKTIHNGTGRAPYPLFITAFDNLVLRQLYRTARELGWSKNRTDSYTEEMRWKDWVKDGLEEFTGERLTGRNITLFQEFDDVRNRRNTEIVHLTYDDELPTISPSEAMGDFQTVLRTILEVYEMCVETRQDLNDD
jgi:hypothetical protein